jgi:DNA-binding transcriptional MerR regulator
VEQTEKTYSIGELAQEFSTTPRTIRFYEEKKLIKPRRNGQGRIYGRRERARLLLIMRGKRLGFRLDDIKEMLDLYDIGDGQEAQLRLLHEKCLERIANLQSQRQDIDEALGELDESCAMIIRYLEDKGCDTRDLERRPSQA